VQRSGEGECGDDELAFHGAKKSRQAARQHDARGRAGIVMHLLRSDGGPAAEGAFARSSETQERRNKGSVRIFILLDHSVARAHLPKKFHFSPKAPFPT
jgi:hypothetical protein